MADVRGVPTITGARRSDIFVAVGVIAVVMMLIIPLPAFILDTLMSVNIVLSLLTILIVLYTRNALDFSVFPTLLLIATVFGLALNVSSTRLILSQGSQFQGKLVRAFGTFVVGAQGLEGYVIGLIIFVIGLLADMLGRSARNQEKILRELKTLRFQRPAMDSVRDD